MALMTFRQVAGGVLSVSMDVLFKVQLLLLTTGESSAFWVIRKILKVLSFKLLA